MKAREWIRRLQVLNLDIDIMGGGRGTNFSNRQLVQHCISPNIPASSSAWYTIMKTNDKTLVHKIITDLETIVVEEEKKFLSQGKRSDSDKVYGDAKGGIGDSGGTEPFQDHLIRTQNQSVDGS